VTAEVSEVVGGGGVDEVEPPGEEEVVAEPEAEPVVAEPEAEPVVAEPEAEPVVPEPEPDVGNPHPADLGQEGARLVSLEGTEAQAGDKVLGNEVYPVGQPLKEAG